LLLPHYFLYNPFDPIGRRTERIFDVGAPASRAKCHVLNINILYHFLNYSYQHKAKRERERAPIFSLLALIFPPFSFFFHLSPFAPKQYQPTQPTPCGSGAPVSLP
jgi:hypothetical protein